MWNEIYRAMLHDSDTNVGEVDQILEIGNYRIFMFFSSHDAAGWKAATNATLTVPSGHSLVVLQWYGSGTLPADPTNRKVRFATSGGVDVINADVFTRTGSFVWMGDLGATLELKKVDAGTTVRLEMWNSDANSRSMGGLIITRLIPAAA